MLKCNKCYLWLKKLCKLKKRKKKDGSDYLKHLEEHKSKFI